MWNRFLHSSAGLPAPLLAASPSSQLLPKVFPQSQLPFPFPTSWQPERGLGAAWAEDPSRGLS